MRFLFWMAWGLGFVTVASSGVAQIAAINDTNTAIILWVDQSQVVEGQARIRPGSRPAVIGSERRGIGIGEQGYATAIAPQSNQPAIGPQGNEPMIGQQGSPPAIPSITNQANFGLPATPPMWPQTNVTVIGPQGAIDMGQQGFGTAISPQGSSPALGQQGFGTAIGQPRTAVQPGQRALTPRSGALNPAQPAMGSAQGSPGGQATGSGGSGK